jgi:hypothetical protein
VIKPDMIKYGLMSEMIPEKVYCSNEAITANDEFFGRV